MKITLCALFALVLASHALAQEPTQVQGVARVVDGDTLAIGATRIRLHGIDAPESKQLCYLNGQGWACGKASAWELARKIGVSPVACQVRDTDRYGRLVAVCQANGINLNAAQVEEGWALAYTTYSKDFVPNQARAQAQKRGIWTSQWESPEKFRKNKAP